MAHSILAVAWHLLTNGSLYDDPGAQYFGLRHDPAIEAKRLQRKIEALGYQVTMTGIAALVTQQLPNTSVTNFGPARHLIPRAQALCGEKALHPGMPSAFEWLVIVVSAVLTPEPQIKT